MGLTLRLLGWMGLAGLAVSFRTAWRIVHPRRDWRPDDWRPSPLPLQAFDLRTSDDVRLRGWIASHSNAPATAICVHGWSANHTEMEWRASRLYDAGFSIMLFDFRACGESEGRVTSMGVFETRDLEAAIAKARAAPELHGAPIVILADSMGASVALIVAAREPAVRAVFSDAAFATMEGAIAWGFRTATGMPAWPFKKLVVWFSERLTGARMRDFSVLEAVGDIAPRPVLIAHGGVDELVSPADAEALYAHAREPKELWLVPEVGHVVGAHVDGEEYARRVTAFFWRALEIEKPVEA